MSRIDEALRRAGPNQRSVAEAAPVALNEVASSADLIFEDEIRAFDRSQAYGDAAEVHQYFTSELVEPVPPELPVTEQTIAPAATPGEAPSVLMGGKVVQRPAGSEKLVVGDGIQPAVVEQYRKIATTLHQVQCDRGVKKVIIASAMAAEGKTLTAVNVALTLSESFRRKVLLIDADLRRPTVHNVFQIPNVAGLSDGLKAERDRKLTLIEVSPYLTILPAGPPDPDPMSGLSSDRMRRIIDEASSKFDWVIIDTPPVVLLPDARLVAEMVDAVVLVIGAGSTPYAMIQRAIDAIDRKRILGVVLNRVEASRSVHGYYHYYGASAAAQS